MCHLAGLRTPWLSYRGGRNGLRPGPLEEIIAHILDAGSEHRDDCVNFLIYNTVPGTTSAAAVKAKFLKRIILGEVSVAEITPTFAFELLSHMRGGASVEVLIDLALGDDPAIAKLCQGRILHETSRCG